jgi:DNA-binding GntR family transcriptional regulator
MLFQDMDEIYSYMDMLEKRLVKLARTVSDHRDVDECRQRCREEHRDANQWLVNVAILLLGSAISDTSWLLSGNLAVSPLVATILISVRIAAFFGLLFYHKKAEREVAKKRKICLESCDQQDIYRQEMRKFQDDLNKLREKAMNIQRSCVTRSSSSAMAE